MYIMSILKGRRLSSFIKLIKQEYIFGKCHLISVFTRITTYKPINVTTLCANSVTEVLLKTIIKLLSKAGEGSFAPLQFV